MEDDTFNQCHTEVLCQHPFDKTCGCLTNIASDIGFALSPPLISKLLRHLCKRFSALSCVPPIQDVCFSSALPEAWQVKTLCWHPLKSKFPDASLSHFLIIQGSAEMSYLSVPPLDDAFTAYCYHSFLHHLCPKCCFLSQCHRDFDVSQGLCSVQGWWTWISHVSVEEDRTATYFPYLLPWILPHHPTIIYTLHCLPCCTQISSIHASGALLLSPLFTLSQHFI